MHGCFAEPGPHSTKFVTAPDQQRIVSRCAASGAWDLTGYPTDGPVPFRLALATRASSDDFSLRAEPMVSTTPSLEFLLWLFRAQRGLFILGAGASAGTSASAGEVRFGQDFLIGPALDYVRGGSFPVSIPVQSDLSRKIIKNAQDVPLSRVFPNRIIRPSTDDLPYRQLVQRMPDGFARLYMKHDLSRVRYSERPRDNYTAFRLFYPAMLMNYNLDGLATEYCGKVHQVVTPHGTIPKEYGSPDVARLLPSVRDYDLQLGSDALVMSVPESCDDVHLWRCLDMMATYSPQFITIIGYTFGRNGKSHDDWISLDSFKRTFRGFAGDIYLIEPRPEPLREMIMDGVKSNRVFGVRGYWNIVAHVFLEAAYSRVDGRSLNYVCDQILDQHGDRVVFPIGATEPKAQH